MSRVLLHRAFSLAKMPRYFLLSLLFELLILWHRQACYVSAEQLASLPSHHGLGSEKALGVERDGGKSSAPLTRRMLPGLGEKRGRFQESAEERLTDQKADAGTQTSATGKADAATQTSATGSDHSWRDLPSEVQLTIARRGYLSRIIESHWMANREVLLGLHHLAPDEYQRWRSSVISSPGPARLYRAVTAAADQAAQTFRQDATPHFRAIARQLRPTQRRRRQEPVQSPREAIAAAERAVSAAVLDYTRREGGAHPEVAHILAERLRQPMMQPSHYSIDVMFTRVRDEHFPAHGRTIRDAMREYERATVGEVRARTEDSIYRATWAATRSQQLRTAAAGLHGRPPIFWALRSRAGQWAARVDANPEVGVRSLWHVPPSHALNARNDDEKAAQQIAQEYALGVWGDVCLAQGLGRSMLSYGLYNVPPLVPVPRGLRRRPVQPARHSG